jgi:curved DNA-binding protein
MAKDFYSILGIDKKASKDDIKKAFRAAAKTHHPDKGGEAEKFKEINEAYEVLSNDQKRQQYDTFGSADPQQGGFGGFSGFSGFNSANAQAQNINFEDIGDMFGSFFGGDPFGRGGQWQQRARRGSDLEVEAHVSFDEAMRGVKKKFRSSYVAGGVLEVDIPAGVAQGNSLKLRGKGTPGQNGGPAGDLYIHILVKDSKTFTRRGFDIISELKIPVFEALLGGEHTIETFWGKEKITVSELTKEGALIRLIGKGVKKGEQYGDHLVHITHKLPKKLNKKMRDLLEQLK